MRTHDHEHDRSEVSRSEPARRDALDADAAECAAASGRWDAVSAGGLLGLQRAAGNRAVQQVLEHARRAATARNAYGGHSASTVAVPPAGTGVIQRETFDGKDTEDPGGFTSLMGEVSSATEKNNLELFKKQRTLEQKKNRTRSEQDLLDAIVRKRKSFEDAKKAASSASSGSGTGTAVASPQKPDKFAGIRAKTEDLKQKAGILLDDSPEQFATEYERFKFHTLVQVWKQALGTEPDYRTESSTEVEEVKSRISRVNRKKAGLDAAQQAVQEAAQEKKRKKEEEDKLLEHWKEQVKTQEGITGKYFELQIKPDKIWTRLLLGWLIGAAITDLTAHPDPFVNGLLTHLKTKREEGQNVVVTLDQAASDQLTVSGMAYWAKVELSVGDLPLSTNEQGTKNLLTSDAEKRGERAHEVAKAFIHETAHWWQLRKYDNVSHPWTTKEHDPGKLPEKLNVHNIPIENAPKDVQLAYEEFTNLAADQGWPKKGYDEAAKYEVAHRWRELTKAEYYDPEGKGKEGPKDMRARELVSHLIEIVYEWKDAKDPDKFKRIFPMGSALLKRVIGTGADSS